MAKAGVYSLRSLGEPSEIDQDMAERIFSATIHGYDDFHIRYLEGDDNRIMQLDLYANAYGKQSFEELSADEQEDVASEVDLYDKERRNKIDLAKAFCNGEVNKETYEASKSLLGEDIREKSLRIAYYEERITMMRYKDVYEDVDSLTGQSFNMDECLFYCENLRSGLERLLSARRFMVRKYKESQAI